ncbi:type VII secretion integral membrane protein EccD [Frankineae bacterium MT45]|nr:type VII secretion integral membrane protein EccD [Frankineae bacterium MT45]
MTPTWSRVTIRAEARRINVAVPADEPIEVFLSELVELFDGSPNDPGPRILTTPLGRRLDSGQSLTTASVMDGDVLYLTSEAAAPAPPIVGEVCEAIGAELRQRTDIWSARHSARAALATSGCAAICLAISMTFVAAALCAAALGGAALLSWGLAAAASRVGREASASALVLVAATLTVSATVEVTSWHRLGVAAQLGAVALAAAVSGVAASSVATRPLVARHASLLLAAFSGAWLAASLAGLNYGQTSALVVAASVVLLTLLPGWALHISAVHNRAESGSGSVTMGDPQLVTSLSNAHALLATFVLVWSAAVLAGCVGLILWGRPWALGLAGATATIAALRARTFPLAIEVFALIGVAASAASGLLLAWALRGPHLPILPSLAAGAALLTALGATFWSPGRQATLRLRLMAHRVERLAWLALLPAAVGVFGGYARLLTVF